ncbi:MAG: methylenetetrahydrofolate reductase [NAD(P)H] [Bacillota bacterium]|jgi:methylenetetrahydrofolate reductase (NADPH)
MSIEEIVKKKDVIFSLEVFPPQKISSEETIYKTLFGLQHLPADFISVTYGAGGSAQQKDKTCQIAALIQKEYRIQAVAHLTCINSTKKDIIDVLQMLKNNNISNILALRGDRNPELRESSDFSYASDLIDFIKEYDDSFYLMGGCYPEGHIESPSLEEDLKNLKIKVDSGAQHLISQLFFANEVFYNFMDKATALGIDVPIEAGIMPITSQSQIEKVVDLSGASLPPEFVAMVEKYADNKEDMKKAGIEYASQQIRDLLQNGIPAIHLYTMNSTEVATSIYENIKDLL